ncbi:MAG: NTF2 fold immunity protein [Bacteroidota bacterium]
MPDQETAKKIVEATWIPIYGRQVIQAERPFKALLIGDSVWAVSGTVHASEGGAAYIEIRAKDCSVKKVTHYK